MHLCICASVHLCIRASMYLGMHLGHLVCREGRLAGRYVHLNELAQSSLWPEIQLGIWVYLVVNYDLVTVLGSFPPRRWSWSSPSCTWARCRSCEHVCKSWLETARRHLTVLSRCSLKRNYQLQLSYLSPTRND